MNIVLNILIAIIIIFALKRHNSSQQLGLGNRRFIVAIACAMFLYLDRLGSFADINFELHYKNTFLWSLVCLPFYAVLLTTIFKSFYKDLVDVKFLLPSIAGTMTGVILFNSMGSEGVALFYPISNEKFAFNIFYNFNLYLMLFMTAVVICLFIFIEYRRKIAIISLIIVGIFIISFTSFSFKAKAHAEKYIKALNLNVVKIHTIPQPLSALNWRILILTKDKRIHDTFLSLKKENNASDYYKEDERTRNVARLYHPADKAVWRIYRQTNPYLKKYHMQISKRHQNNNIFKELTQFSILKDTISYNKLNCLRYKDLRYEGARKTLRGNLLFCRDAKNNKKTFIGTKTAYKEIQL